MRRILSLTALLAAALLCLSACSALPEIELFPEPQETRQTLDFEDFAGWTTRDWQAADDAGRWQAVKAMLEHIDPDAFTGVRHGMMVEQLNSRIAAEVGSTDRFFEETEGMFTLRYHAEQVQQDLAA